MDPLSAVNIKDFPTYRFAEGDLEPVLQEQPLRELSRFSRTLRWIHRQRSLPATILKIVTFAILTLSLIGIVLIRRFCDEQRAFREERRAETSRRMLCSQRSWIDSMIKGLELEFDQLPFYTSEGLVESTREMKFPPTALNVPIVRGRGPTGLPFIAFKMRSRSSSQSFICTLFQSPVEHVGWVLSAVENNGRYITKNIGLALPLANNTDLAIVDEETIQTMAQVIRGEHTDYIIDRT